MRWVTKELPFLAMPRSIHCRGSPYVLSRDPAVVLGKKKIYRKHMSLCALATAVVMNACRKKNISAEVSSITYTGNHLLLLCAGLCASPFQKKMTRVPLFSLLCARTASFFWSRAPQVVEIFIYTKWVGDHLQPVRFQCPRPPWRDDFVVGHRLGTLKSSIWLHVYSLWACWSGDFWMKWVNTYI